jgi:hypothetical protein
MLESRKKVYDQVHSSFFLWQARAQMSRHLEKCHGTEMDVAKILAMPVKSEARRDAFIELTRMGDYHYNCDVLSKKSGILFSWGS